MRKRTNIKENWGIVLVSFLDLVIIIIALVLSTDFDGIQNLKDKMLESRILSMVVYIIVYLSYGIYFIFLIKYTLLKKHKNVRYYYLYFIQLLLMTAIFNGLLLFGSYFTWSEINSCTQDGTKEFQKEFYDSSTTIVNSIFVGVMAYLGVMLPRIIKNSEHRSNIYIKK